MRKIRKIVAAALLLFGWSQILGCISYHEKPLDPQKISSEFEARNFESSGLHEFILKNEGNTAEWPLAAWDPGRLALAALYYHPDMDIARARFGVTEAKKITAGARPNPQFGFAPGYDVTPEGAISPWILNFSLSIPVETAGKRGYRLASAEYQSEAVRYKLASAAWTVRSRVWAAVLALYANEKTEIVLQGKIDDLTELVRSEERLLASGEVSRIELTRVRISLDESLLFLKEIQKKHSEALARLSEALSVPPSALRAVKLRLDLFDSVPVPDENTVRDLKRSALSNRPDILSLLAEYKASEAALQLEIAKQYPNIEIGPGYVWDEGENKYSLGIRIPLPLFNRNRGPIAEAEARRKEREAQFVALQAEIAGELERTQTVYALAAQKLQTADLLVQNREKELKSVADLFQAGEAARPDLLSVRLAYLSAAQSRLNALVDAWKSLLALEDSIQQPLHH